MAESGETHPANKQTEGLLHQKPFTIAEEQAEGILPLELDYSMIPEMSVADVFPQSGFFQDAPIETLPYFLKSVKKAIGNPEWLFVEEGFEEYKQRIAQGVPVPQKFDPRFNDTQRLKEFIETKSPDEIARAVNSPRYNFLGMSTGDIFIRALEAMALEYPNLMM